MTYNIEDFTPNDYMSACRSRQNDLAYLRAKDDYIILAVYFAGVSIECMFKAYILLYTKEFDGRHNLYRLFSKSLLVQKYPIEEQIELKIRMATLLKSVSREWKNSLRYTSEKRLKRLVGKDFAQAKGKTLEEGIQKYFKSKTNDLFEATKQILKIGENKWT